MRISPVLVAVFACLFFATSASAATTWTVNSTGDDPPNGDPNACAVSANPCTLRDAVAGAASGDRIEFGSTTHVTLTSALQVPKTLTIDGCAASDTGTTPCTTISAPGNDDAFFITADGVTITRLAIDSAHNGIEVSSGDGTTITGNYLGLDAAGASSPLANSGVTIDSAATGTDVGTYLDDAFVLRGSPNVVQAAHYGIYAGGNGSTLQDNLVGLNPAGTAKEGAPDQWGIAETEGSPDEARLLSNRVAIGGTGGYDTGGILLSGTNTVVRDNTVGEGTSQIPENVGGPGVGIEAIADGAELGGSDQDSGNTVANAGTAGIAIAGGKDTLVKNNDLKDNDRGVVVKDLDNGAGSNATGNVIGGDTAATANVITGSTHDAIEFLPRTSGSGTGLNTGNAITLNSGSDNGTDPTNDLFVDLGPDGPGNVGDDVNDNIEAPAVTFASGTSIRGTAKPGATVLVFTQPSGAGSLGTYLGQATLTGGTWSRSASLANGTKVVALQTDASDGSSELSPERAVDSVAPNTTITSGPSSNTLDTTPTFTFTSTEAGSKFECKVDAGAYAPCTSPRTTSTLSYGAHTFSVRATDASGNTDATPATRSFTVAKPTPNDTTPPTTTITKKPKALTRSREPAFAFSSNEPSYIECSIDGGKYSVCGAIGPLKDGKHTLKARAVDGAGNVDPTPATYTFRVDATAPKVKLGATAKRKGKTLRIKVACPKDEKSGPCKGTLTVKRKGKTIAKKAYSVAAGRTKTVVLKPKHLPAKGVKLKLSTTGRDRLGNKKPVKKTAKVK